MIYLEDKIKFLIKNFENNKLINTVFVFGSYNTEFYNKNSDIDFAVIFTDNVTLEDEMKIVADISEIIHNDDIDLVNFNKASLRLQFRILKEGKIIYEKNPDITSDFIETTLNRYFDMEYYFRKSFEEYRTALKEEYCK